MNAKTTLTTVLTSTVMGLATLAAGLMTVAPAWAQAQPPVDRVVVIGKRLATPSPAPAVPVAATTAAPAADPVPRVVVTGKRLPADWTVATAQAKPADR